MMTVLGIVWIGRLDRLQLEVPSLRAELVRRFALAASRDRRLPERRNPVTPA